MDIGVDSDGVLYRFSRVYNQHLIDLGHDVDLEGEPDTWDYFTQYGYTTEQFCQHMDELVDAKRLFWDGELYDHNIPRDIKQLRDAGHKIHIVTNRFSGKAECSKEATKFFFVKVGIEYDSLTFTKDKTSVKTDIFLEDNVKNYDALKAAGVEAWLVDRPYNQDGPDEYRRRVRDFWEFAEKILMRDYWSSYFKRRTFGLPDRSEPRDPMYR